MQLTVVVMKMILAFLKIARFRRFVISSVSCRTLSYLDLMLAKRCHASSTLLCQHFNTKIARCSGNKEYGSPSATQSYFPSSCKCISISSLSLTAYIQIFNMHQDETGIVHLSRISMIQYSLTGFVQESNLHFPDVRMPRELSEHFL